MPYSRVTRTAYGADAIRYARGHGKGHNGQPRRNIYTAGVNMLPDHAVRFEEQLQPLWLRMDARHKIQVNRCVVSFSPNELDSDSEADQLTALEIGRRIAETNAPDCQSAVFVQSDGKGHKLHLHILTNDVRISDHKGVDSRAYYHPHFRRLVDQICKEYFTLDEPGKAPERVSQSVRGRRAANEKIAERNRAEVEDAELEGRVPVLETEKYIWQDDLRERIKRAAAQATDEGSFAQALRLDGVELLEQRQKDGTVTYIHHATKTMPEYYVYELVDISGFQAGDKVPANLKSRSCKMGTNYSPEGIAGIFRQAQPEVQEPEVSIDVPGIVASVREPKQEPVKSEKLTPQEKDKLALDHAVALAKQFVEPIVRLSYPDADEEWTDQLYERFIRWRNALRKKWQEKGRTVPPIYCKDTNGDGQIVAEQLDRQYRAFWDEWQKSEAAKELERIQKERMALAADIIQTAEEMDRKQEVQPVEIG